MGYGRGRTKQWRTVMRSLSAAFMITFAVYLVVCLFTLVYGIDIVYRDIGDHSYTLYFVFFAIVPLITISGSLLSAYYLLVVAAIVASAIWLLFKSGRKFADELTMKGTARNHSPFFDLCGLMFAVFFINTVIVLFLTASGNSPQSPVDEMEDWELLFLLANASVWEELIARVAVIGIPLLMTDTLFLREPPRPKWRYILGGAVRIRWAEATLVIISAVVFGFAHYEGWGSWKVFPAGIAGLAFGYMFLKHGLPAAIMLHFSFDYLSMPITVFDDLIALQLLVALGVLLWIGMGLAFAVYFTVRIVEFIAGRTFMDEDGGVPAGAQGWGDERRQAPVPREGVERQWHPTAGVGRGLFICPACGSYEARWHEGGLQCLGCGRLFK